MTDTTWWAEVTWRNAGLDALTDEQADALMSVPGVEHAHTNLTRDLTIAVSCDATNLATATSTAIDRAETAYAAAFGTATPAHTVRATTRALRDSENIREMLPDMWSLTDMANAINVTRQRANQIAKMAGFPEPITVVNKMGLYLRSEVEAWLKGWDRTSGRPRKQ